MNNVQDLNNQPVYFKNESFEYYEWQIGLGASYWIDMCSFAFVPYMGIKWSSANVSLDVRANDGSTNVHLRDLESDNGFGYAVGLTIVGCRKFAFTLEKRFADEDAYYVNAQFRY